MKPALRWLTRDHYSLLEVLILLTGAAVIAGRALPAPAAAGIGLATGILAVTANRVLRAASRRQGTHR